MSIEVQEAALPKSKHSEDILGHILEVLLNLPFREDRRINLHACSLVSHQWRSVALPLLWQDMTPQLYSLKTLSSLLDFLTASRSNPAISDDYISFVRNVYIGPWVRYDPSDLSEVFSRTADLLGLFSNDQLQKVVIYSPIWDIERFGSHSTLPIFSALSHRLSHLKYFEICGVWEYGAPAIKLLNQLPTRLKTLILDNVRPNLSLNRGSQQIPFDRILSFPEISSFTLADSSLTVSRLCNGLRIWGPNLHNLTLRNCPNLHDSRAIDALVDFCPNLRDLEISGQKVHQHVHQITTESMCRLVDACQALETLHCTDLSSVTDEFLEYYGSRPRRLRTLTLKRCGAVGKSVYNLKGWKRLQRIRIEPGRTLEIDPFFKKALLTDCLALEWIWYGRTQYQANPSLDGNATTEQTPVA
ncbi:hypothetical protein BC937DRAFT_90859 [Endogone sp. FLAS-F59071]|nr:hypothetical protein BC937DRAFT_90859 [Endogone sp. FLAS-F59071]|eukprot:RUS16734.1 hypothetical protein BC937DRAFT_90859 [Endogone sp. FLAS-F59071]